MGGPLFGKSCDAEIRFKYPVCGPIVDFFINRCRNGWAYDLMVSAPRMLDASELEVPEPSRRATLAFSGGRDSRLLLGMLMEMGVNPVCVYHGNDLDPVAGVSELKTSWPVRGVLSEVLMPAFMQAGPFMYLGQGMDEAMYKPPPWRQYYDLASHFCLRDMSDLLASVGVQTKVLAPLTIAPRNVVQNMLHSRYPHLAAYQYSCKPFTKQNKNGRTSLYKLCNNISPWKECPLPLFKTIMIQLMDQDFSYPKFHPNSNFEARCVIHRLRSRPELSHVKPRIQDAWAGQWIDYLHTYINPTVDEGVLSIFKEYACDVSHSPDQSDYRLPVEPTVLQA